MNSGKLDMTGSTNQKNAPVALVTGGAQRVGAVIVQALASAGYRVAIHYNSSSRSASTMEEQIAEQGGEAMSVQADLRDEAAVQAMIEQVYQRFGRIDAMVNSAAIWERKPLLQVTAQDVRDHFEVNTLGTFLCCQKVGAIMIQQESGGSIVNISDWAIVRPYLDYAAYFPSKGAIPALTRSMAVELAAMNPNIRVNAVLPGPVLLPANLSKEERATAVAGTLLKREGSPENVADAVLFLLRNDFVAGVCLPVDGGRSIAPGE